MNKHLSGFWVVSGLVAGCAAEPAEDASDDVATEAITTLAGHVTLGSTAGTTCAMSTLPQLVFFGTDSTGRENYNFNTTPRATSGQFCIIVAQILFPSNFCVRIRGESMAGRAFSTPGASGTVHLRSSWLQVVGGFVDLPAPVPVSTTSVPFSGNIFQPGPLSPRGLTSLQLVVQPSVTASGGVSPSIVADFSFGGATTTLDAFPC